MVSQAHQLQSVSNRFLSDCKKDCIAAEPTKTRTRNTGSHQGGQIIHSHVTKDEDISYDPIPAVEMRRGALTTCSYQHSCMHTIPANHNKSAFTTLHLLITRREHGPNQTLFGFSAGWLQGLVQPPLEAAWFRSNHSH